MHAKRPSLGALLLALIPFVGVCFFVPLWDRIYPMVLGIPFNLFWLILWIVISPLCMWGAYQFEVPRSEHHNRKGP
jgi:membrane protein required for beta-lactamase induction